MGIKCMLSIDKRCNTATLLNLSNRMERQRGFT
ncbi:recombinase A [Synechococcus sp. WH 5701]|nr:recombinase A [Synechococcus sp. WH 5701]